MSSPHWVVPSQIVTQNRILVNCSLFFVSNLINILQFVDTDLWYIHTARERKLEPNENYSIM